MHPAYSVIVFTTLSGAGYGLLTWLAFSVLVSELVPLRPWPGILAVGLAMVLVSVGLISSTLHLGRPERAWRAFSQWRTSWLSREGVSAVVSFPIVGLFLLVWVLKPQSPWLGVLALAVALIAQATVYCTGMIYASLPTIRAWKQPLVVPNYIVLSLTTGGLIALLMSVAWTGTLPKLATLVEVVLCGLALAMKSAYWASVDSAPPISNAGNATGLGYIGKVRPLEPPHSRPNYVMREMGYAIARKHAEKLRRLAMLALYAMPVLSLMLALLLRGNWILAPLLVAVASAGVGVLVERWLFFAEAEHVVMVYYGEEAA